MNTTFKDITLKNNNLYYYHYKVFNRELSIALVPIVFILILYYNNYIKYVSLIFLLIGIIGTIDSFYKSIKEKLLGIFIWGVLMHSIGFYPLLNTTKYFEYNNIIYIFGLIALAIVYFLPYWPYAVSRKFVALVILGLYGSYALYHNIKIMRF
jgi:hypothetical protein